MIPTRIAVVPKPPSQALYDRLGGHHLYDWPSNVVPVDKRLPLRAGQAEGKDRIRANRLLRIMRDSERIRDQKLTLSAIALTLGLRIQANIYYFFRYVMECLDIGHKHITNHTLVRYPNDQLFMLCYFDFLRRADS